ncbi:MULTISPECIES: hypothetical protein [Acetobacterium]|uniref:Uncharacterized protein n=1 Tax=Acetobacterium wieringae TaxID=52694 RepID=A0A1F2PDT3_9FIRM|nr:MULTISPECIES: hypothetical protein [Acetobacterium]OFV69195.1 hypothetical protein ACWI_33890 [Acetobacterium wieringae]OXS26878.1 MAG: hypothetical protein BI182_12155 [Acetobacterium sp. MES1]
MNKGTLFTTGNKKKVYQVVGRYGKDIVLADTSENGDEVLIYGPTELQGLIDEKRFELVLDGKKKRGGKK